MYRFEIEPLKDLSYTDATGKRMLEVGEFIIQVGNQKINIELKQ